jgi:pimeloyl-ACP methyl ester carboxylesterase
MRSRAALGTAALAAIALAAAGPRAVSAHAAIAYAACGTSNEFACAHLVVPLDPSGATPGTLTLALRRHRAPVGEASSAVVALAGGPGQAAIPFAGAFKAILGPLLATRDLLVYDQRGTGRSHPLSCHGFESGGGSFSSFGSLISTCAEQIGAERAFYTTPDSVADIEAIRQAGGYQKLVIYGTSYGTKVALEYAQEHPEHVEALILDSVVPPGGPEPLARPTFAAVPRILRQLCAFHACAQITHNPVRDLARVVRRMRGAPLRGHVIDGHGHAHPVLVTANELLGILLEGDFNPLLRAEFIAAIRGAAGGDTAALARLLERAAGGEREGGEDFDIPLYYATSCEEQLFPWSRTLGPHARLAQARRALAALPPGAFAPFTAATAFALSDMRTCAYWPFATPAPPRLPQPLPNVPTLILSGADDLRTPTSGARAVAAQIPDAYLLVVPNTGHAVLVDEPTSCARRALYAQFSDQRILPCPRTPPPPLLALAPLPPTRLAAVASERGYRGRPGRTLHAVQLTLADFARQFLLSITESLGSGRLSGGVLGTGGLRAGWAQLHDGALRFHDYTYIPGVSLSGVVRSERVDLRIGGTAAARGTLRLGSHHELVGRLGGQRVRLRAGGAGGAGGGGPAAFGARTARVAAPTPRHAGAAGPAGPLPLPASVARLAAQLARLPLGLDEASVALPALLRARVGGGL